MVNDAHDICAEIRAGKDTLSTLSTWEMYQSGLANEDVGWVIGQAIASYCLTKQALSSAPSRV